MEELDFLLRHEEKIPTTMEKLDKEKLALLKEIGIVVRKIARNRKSRQNKKLKKNNRTNPKKEVLTAGVPMRHILEAGVGLLYASLQQIPAYSLIWNVGEKIEN